MLLAVLIILAVVGMGLTGAGMVFQNRKKGNENTIEIELIEEKEEEEVAKLEQA